MGRIPRKAPGNNRERHEPRSRWSNACPSSEAQELLLLTAYHLLLTTSEAQERLPLVAPLIPRLPLILSPTIIILTSDHTLSLPRHSNPASQHNPTSSHPNLPYVITPHPNLTLPRPKPYPSLSPNINSSSNTVLSPNSQGLHSIRTRRPSGLQCSSPIRAFIGRSCRIRSRSGVGSWPCSAIPRGRVREGSGGVFACKRNRSRPLHCTPDAARGCKMTSMAALLCIG